MKKLFVVMACCCLCLGLSACASSSAAEELTQIPPTVSLEAQPLQTEEITALTAFSAQLFQQTLAEEAANPVVSPLSVYLALGMAAAGAEGLTAEQFSSLLGLSPQDLQPACLALQNLLAEPGGQSELWLNNAIWLDDETAVEEAFLQTIRDYHAGQVFRQDLQAKQTLTAINSWVAEKTNGLIPEILTELSPDSALVLLNTLYLDAHWQTPFQAASTRQRDFYPEAGSTQAADFMHSGPLFQQQSLKSADWEGILLPYDDEQLAFLALLPAEGQAIRSASLEPDTLAGLLASAQVRDQVSIILPKFEVSYRLDLLPVLSQLGLTAALDPGQADFSGLGTRNGYPLYLAQAEHRVVMRVDEEGTEAAAATALDMNATGDAPEEPLILCFDRPFLYAVVDLTTGLPLFLGLLENPVQ